MLNQLINFLGPLCPPDAKHVFAAIAAKAVLQLLANDNNAARSFPGVVTRAGWTGRMDGMTD